MDDIYLQLGDLRGQYPDEESTTAIDNWEKSARALTLTTKLQENDAMKLIINKYKLELQTIDKELLTNTAIFENEKSFILGRILHARKQWISDFLKIFSGAEVRLVGLSKYINEKYTQATDEGSFRI